MTRNISNLTRLKELCYVGLNDVSADKKLCNLTKGGQGMVCNVDSWVDVIRTFVIGADDVIVDMEQCKFDKGREKEVCNVEGETNAQQDVRIAKGERSFSLRNTQSHCGKSNNNSRRDLIKGEEYLLRKMHSWVQILICPSDLSTL